MESSSMEQIPPSNSEITVTQKKDAEKTIAVDPQSKSVGLSELTLISDTMEHGSSLDAQSNFKNFLRGFASVPHDIWRVILGWSDLFSIANLMLSCKEFYALANEPNLWRHLCRRDEINLPPAHGT